MSNARKKSLFKGLTIMEMIISLAIIAVLFAVVVPQFKNIENSWASKEGAAEALQNGRVLISHLNRNLSKAARITAVSGHCKTDGYIEFEGNDTVTYRYEIGADNIVEFGPVGSLVDLAGPVSQLQFTCYDAQDLDTPITTVGEIRSVNIRITLTNPGSGQDQTFTTQAYLRTNATLVGGTLSPGVTDVVGSKGEQIAMCQIDSTHYLWSNGDEDLAVLSVDPTTDTITVENTLTLADRRQMPAICKIDNTHYLWSYCLGIWAGSASVLTLNPADWSITEGLVHEFDSRGQWEALCRIDATHYLCCYTATANVGIACVLTVDTSNWTVSSGSFFQYTTGLVIYTQTAKIDDEHYLCIYKGVGDNHFAFVITVEAGTYAIDKGPAHIFTDSVWVRVPLLRIDSTHYICLYSSHNEDIVRAVILNVIPGADPASWMVTSGTPFEVVATSGEFIGMAQLEPTTYVCVYTGANDASTYAVRLAVDTGSWTISRGDPVSIYTPKIETGPVLGTIDSTCAFCVHTDWATGGDTHGVIITDVTELLP